MLRPSRLAVLAGLLATTASAWAQPAPAPASRPASSAPVAAAPVLQALPPRVLLRARALRALVRVENAHLTDVGVLVGDRRTVLVRSGFLDGRPFLVSPLSEPSSVYTTRAAARVERAGEGRQDLALWLHLDGEVRGAPLERSPEEPALDGRVYLLVRRLPGQPPELVETRIVAVGEGSFSVAVPLGPGGLVLDRAGRLLGVGADLGGRAIRLARLREGVRPAPSVSVLPVFGLRAGYQHGGLLGRGGVITFEGGVALWDRLALVLRLGAGIGSSGVTSLPPTGGLGQGVADSSLLTLDFGLEARYRLLLTRTAPFYFEPAVGFQLVYGGRSLTGLGLYSTDPGCDPAVRGCPLTVRDADGISGLTHTGFGPSFGADLRVGIFVFGYRFTPRALSHDLPNLHTATVGLVGI